MVYKKNRQIFYIICIILMFINVSFAKTPLNVQSSGSTLKATIRVCLNASKNPVSCTDYPINGSEFTITSNVPNHTYTTIGMIVVDGEYSISPSLSNCNLNPNNGYCMFTINSSSSQNAYINIPRITSLQPNISSTAGTNVNVTGTGLDSVTKVYFGTEEATILSKQATSINLISPPYPQEATVDVTFYSTTYEPIVLTNEYTYNNDAAITSITPNTGSTNGGTSVTITGLNFNYATGVTFGGLSGSSFTKDSDTQITVTTPPQNVEGYVDVVVQSPYGDATLTNGFKYFDPPVINIVNPNTGPTAGGTNVTISGSNFT